MKDEMDLYKRKDYKIHFVYFIYLICFVFVGLTFNLDTENAFVIEGEQRGSHFGFSVALWQDFNNQKWVVVAAPKWQSVETNVSHTNEDTSSDLPLGTILTYDMNGKASTIATIPVFSEEQKKALNLVRRSKFPSIGLGETLSTTNNANSLLVCAPRQLHLVEIEGKQTVSLRGACYLMQDQNSPPKVLSPYEGNLVIWGQRSVRTPSVNTGFGAFLSNDSTVVLGIPTMFYDTGAICSYVVRSSENEDFRCTTASSSSFEHSFYEGWAVVEGSFDGQKLYYAVSVPGKPTLIGKIIFYTKGLRRVPNFALLGEDFGGGFGNSLVVGDFNGDSVSDLAVSSHLSLVKSFASNNEEYTLIDSGKVFVYYSPLLKIGKQQKMSVLSGLNTKTYFGYSIFCPGDLNDDGFQDLLVGAPYDGSGKIYVFSGSRDGLIIYPTQIIGQTELLKPGIRIGKGIGFSLGGGIDIDSNGYPDIVIGAPFSSSSIVVRSSPVVKFQLESQLDDGSGVINLGKRKCLIILPDKTVANLTCFNMTLNVQYNSQIFKQRLVVSIGIDLDTRKSSSRVLFNNNERSFYLTREISNALHSPEPFNLLVYVKPLKPSLSDPIITKIRLNLVSKSRMAKHLNIKMGMVGINSPFVLPVVDPFSKREEEIRVRLQCQDDTTCYTRPDLVLAITSLQNFTIGLKRILDLNFSLTVKDDPAFQVDLRGSIPPVFEFARVARSERPEKDGREIWCMSSAGQMNQTGSSISCLVSDYLPINSKVNFTLLFSYFPVKAAKSLKKSLNKNFEFNFKILSDIKDRNEKDNHVTWTPNTTLNNKILFSGFPVPKEVTVWTNDSKSIEKARKIFLPEPKTPKKKNVKLSSTDYAGAELKHIYVIDNVGYSPIIEAKVKIIWPRGIDEMPLTLLKEITTSGDIKCEDAKLEDTLQYYQESDAKEIEIFDSVSGSTNRRKKTRNIRKEDELKKFRNSSLLIKKVVNVTKSSPIHLNCKDFFDCAEVSCKIGTLLSKEEIRIDISFIAIASMLKMFDHRRFILSSNAYFEEEFLSLKNYSEISTTLIVGKPILKRSELLRQQWWIIFISVIVGILILALLSALLYKLGFFKRKRLQKAEITKSEEPHQPLFSSENPEAVGHSETHTVGQCDNPMKIQEDTT